MNTEFKTISKGQGFLQNVRCNFPDLIDPKPINEGDTPKFNIEILIPKSEKKVVKDLENYIKEKINKSDLKPAQKQAVLKIALDNQDAYNKYAILKDGDLLNEKRLDDEKEARPEYTDHYILRLKRKIENGKPAVVDQKAIKIPDMYIASSIMAGYWVNVVFSGFTYSFNGTPGFTMGLNAVQLVKEDEVFGQENPFEALEFDSNVEDDENTDVNSNPFE